MTREHLSQMAQAVSLFHDFAHYIDTLQTFEPVQPSNETAEHLQPNQPIDSKQQSLKRPSFQREPSTKAMHPPPFVAREAELTQLHQCLDRVVAGNGQTVFVTGEAGRGKTALIQHFARQAASSHPDLIVVGGNCNAFTGVGDPFLPFRETLALLAGDVEARFRAGSISTAQAAQLWNLLPVTVQTLLDHGPDLIGTFLAANSLVERMSQITPPDDEQLVRLKKHVEQMVG
ncbi:ATP-binding protein [Chloroflexi bacterium TSY]|nr:ATP-binding protein [Chloroflexi bacterium TSY]